MGCFCCSGLHFGRNVGSGTRGLIVYHGTCRTGLFRQAAFRRHGKHLGRNDDGTTEEIFAVFIVEPIADPQFEALHQ